jgi:hypothetical protein
LLSEIHPLGTAQFNPLVQAQRWYGLLSSQDLAALRARGRIAFVDAIELIHRRAAEAGQRLVVRDWSHLDFTGVPFVAKPAYRLLTAAALKGRFDLRQACTVRHPLDQWLSLRQLTVVKGKLTLDTYLAGYRRFAEQARAIGFFRYEDFAAQPSAIMKELCRALDVRFDRHFTERWSSYTFVTGDVRAVAVALRSRRCRAGRWILVCSIRSPPTPTIGRVSNYWDTITPLGVGQRPETRGKALRPRSTGSAVQSDRIAWHSFASPRSRLSPGLSDR